MERSNDILAKGLAFLVLKIVHKKSEAKEYSPDLLANMLRNSIKETRSLDEVNFEIFIPCRVLIHIFTIFN